MAINPTLAQPNVDYSQGMPKPKNELDMQMFLTLLTTQLANQNPLQPMDDASFFGQIAQLGTVQGMDHLIKSQQVSEAAALLGKKVTAVRPMTDGDTGSNDTVTGTVVGLVNKNGTYMLNLQQADGGIVQVEISNVQKVEVAAPSSTGEGAK